MFSNEPGCNIARGVSVALVQVLQLLCAPAVLSGVLYRPRYMREWPETCGAVVYSCELLVLMLQACVQRFNDCCVSSCFLQAGAGPYYYELQMILESIVCTAAKLYKLCACCTAPDIHYVKSSSWCWVRGVC
jgi:hypothetical protein